MSEPVHTVVLGLGNPLRGDDGLGLAGLGRLGREWRLPADVRLVDGGMWGLQLLPLVEQADAVLLLDAIDAGRDPGALVILEREELPRMLAHKLSSHQVAVPEVLAVCELRGTMPARIAAMGLQPATVTPSTALSPVVARQLGNLILAAVARLRAWGHRAVRAPSPSCERVLSSRQSVTLLRPPSFPDERGG
jgi:hydrogenase maturation protease